MPHCEPLAKFLKTTPAIELSNLCLERTHTVEGPKREDGTCLVQTFFKVNGTEKCVYTEHDTHKDGCSG